MKKTLFLFLSTIFCSAVFTQTVTLTFTAQDAGNQYVQLNRIVITNLTRSWQETIFWPDTTLTMQNSVGIENHSGEESFVLFQNNPNPFYGTTDMKLTIAEGGAVTLEIADVNGRIIETQSFASLQRGTHSLRVSLRTPGTYVMTARQNGQTSSIKMICNGGGGSNSIEYFGETTAITYVLKSNTNHPFCFGDMMEYVGYATINGAEAESQRITQTQGSSQTFILQFAETQTQAQMPTVSTTMASNVSENSATCGGNVISDGGATVTARGVCWSTSNNPTISNSHTTDGNGTGNYISNLTGLSSSTTYYVRAYATNSVGTTYGNEVNFTTSQAIQMPIVTTIAASNIMENSATCGGVVNTDGGTTITTRGVCWSTSHNPTINNNHTTDGSGTGSFSSSLTGLSASTTYYVRAYATNSVGTAYGNEVSFTTSQAVQTPTVTTIAASNITENSATCGGVVNTDGGSTVTMRGVCWSTSHNPTIINNHTTEGGGAGGFYSSLTSLTAGTTYYVRAYATNSVGTAYGNEVSFTTSSVSQLPTVITTAANNVTDITAICGGIVTNDGGNSVIVRGVCYSTSHNPTTSDSHTTDGDGLGSFTCNLTGLVLGTTYYVRAYAINSMGTAYGNEMSFTTTLFNCGSSTLVDIDNNVYNTVQIGQQCWMKENLRTTKYADGTPIAHGMGHSLETAHWYFPENDPYGPASYGLLYNWPAVMRNSSSSSTNPSGVQGICPNGWHVPSDAEWTQLTNYVSSQSQYVCGSDSTFIAKALADSTGWDYDNHTCAVGNFPGNNNATGFSALPASYYEITHGYGGTISGGNYLDIGGRAFFWSSTEPTNHCAIFYTILCGLQYLERYSQYSSESKYRGMSVRCLKNQ